MQPGIKSEASQKSLLMIEYFSMGFEDALFGLLASYLNLANAG
jgi:hypothetical protein